MKKISTFALMLVILIGISQHSFSQNSIELNGENIKVKKFIVNSTGKMLSRMEYEVGDNLFLSPFFGQKNPKNIGGKTNCEIGYTRLGFLCPEAYTGKYRVDYKNPGEFLPLFATSKSEESWDNLIFDYFTNHYDDVRTDFMDLWNSEKYSTNKSKRELLMLPANKDVREIFYSKFLDEEITATYTVKTKRELEINAKLELLIQADLNEYLISRSVDEKTANKIKSETKANIEKRVNSTNIIEIKYYKLKLNGTFQAIVKDYAKVICEKITNSNQLTSFEKKFYDEYMKRNDVFLISNMQYISYKIDKSKITNLITSISQDIDASLAKNQIKGLEPSFSANVTLKISKEVSEDFKSEGGYIMQIAESGQFAQLNADCK